MQLLFAMHVAATMFMFGLIWFIQIVHYPLLDKVTRETFVDYEKAHMRLTAWVVIPPMMLELLTGGFLLWRQPGFLSPTLLWTASALLAGIWLSTMLLQAPMHKKLATGFRERIHRLLVATNWIRTTAWTLRAAILIYVLTRSLQI